MNIKHLFLMFIDDDNLNLKISEIHCLLNAIKIVPTGLPLDDLKECNINIRLQFNAKLKAQQPKSILEQIISSNYDNVFMKH